ncbi:MAG TPA: CcoQ/FixQ family Cbb3-type cytochrome c oxidase assembly chaperone [Bacteroidia bacterium]|jgi:cytochrome c oxidase cbb3-type subunit 3|nr:CcoQ/FixQ family Cbb3-type cytochrome c oxidase assembly chaperone [Bacteroidia bacterium]
MKFINYLQSIAGVGIFPLLSLLIFFIFFIVLGIWALRVKKEHILELERIPFEDKESGKNDHPVK